MSHLTEVYNAPIPPRRVTGTHPTPQRGVGGPSPTGAPTCAPPFPSPHGGFTLHAPNGAYPPHTVARQEGQTMDIPHNHPERIRLMMLGTLNRLTDMGVWLEAEAADAAWLGTSLPAHLKEAARQLRYIRETMSEMTGVDSEVTE